VPIVITVNQRASRRNSDRVPEALRLLGQVATLRRFERTVGDEVQGVLADPAVAVAVVLDLVRDGEWHVGVGVGPVERPLPRSARAGRGPAFALSRQAVDAARKRPQRIAVRGADRDLAADAEAVLTLLSVIVRRRSAAAWKAVDLMEEGLTITEAAARLGITRQAVGQRLATGLWQQDLAARPAAARLLARAAASS